MPLTTQSQARHEVHAARTVTKKTAAVDTVHAATMGTTNMTLDGVFTAARIPIAAEMATPKNKAVTAAITVDGSTSIKHSIASSRICG